MFERDSLRRGAMALALLLAAGLAACTNANPVGPDDDEHFGADGEALESAWVVELEGVRLL